MFFVSNLTLHLFVRGNILIFLFKPGSRFLCKPDSKSPAPKLASRAAKCDRNFSCIQASTLDDVFDLTFRRSKRDQHHD